MFIYMLTLYFLANNMMRNPELDMDSSNLVFNLSVIVVLEFNSANQQKKTNQILIDNLLISHSMSLCLYVIMSFCL